MRYRKSQNLSFNTIICLLLIIQFFNVPQLGSKTDNNEIIELFPEIFENSAISKNYLFTYKESDKDTISQILGQFNPFYLHFYRNFPVGFVTLDIKAFEKICFQYPAFFTSMHESKRTQVIPSHDKLDINGLSKFQQLDYVSPASIIRAKTLYDRGIDGSNIKIAIIDSGIDDSHGDFAGRIDYQQSFVNTTLGFSAEETPRDAHGHGTHVAGIAAGAGLSYPGIAYNARLYNFKAVNMAGYSTPESVLAAIDESINQKVDIISISLGSGSALPWDKDDEISLAANIAVDKGISVVVAAGNEGQDNPLATISSPAAASKVITVGATNVSTKVISFSSRGPSYNYRMDPDVVAPGVQIIAPLASGGVLQKAFNAIVGISLSDYISLSGTSMATPVVSGAIALLKQQFSTATPATLRAALQESAVDLGSNESVYTQGSGLVDIAAAFNLLENTKIANDFALISSNPRANTNDPIDFADRISFPGDKARMTLSFVTGTGGAISWRISDSIKRFISFDTEPRVQEDSGYFEKSVDVSIPLNTSPGVYQGSITYTFLSKDYSISYLFTIKHPKAKLYLDTHYTGKDDSIFNNYRSLDEFLVSNSSFDMNEYETSLTWENLSQNDILILSDLEYPLSSREIEIISKFHQNNGSILLVTSTFPYFNPLPYSQIVEKLGFQVNFTDRTDIIDYVDNGRSRDIVALSPEEYEISWELDNPLFFGVTYFPSLIGTGFKVNRSDSRLRYTAEVFSSSHLILAGFEPPDKGKLLIVGSENLLYSNYLTTTSGQSFTHNIFNWLQPKTGLSVNAEIRSDSRLLEISAHPISSSLPNLSVDISFSNGTSHSGISFPYNVSLGFYYLTIYIGSQQSQQISIIIKNSTNILKTFTLVELTPSTLPDLLDLEINPIASSDISTPSWVDSMTGITLIDQGLNISLNHNSKSSIESTLLISPQFENTLDVIIPPLKGMKNYIVEKELIKSSSTRQSIIWEVPANISAGFHSYEIIIWMFLEDNDSLPVLLTVERKLFYIPDPEPTLHDISTIGDRTLDFYQNIETTADIPTWNYGEKIGIHLYGKDVNNTEFKVHIHLIHYYLWFADRLVLDNFELQASSNNHSEFIGEFVVPTDPIPIPNEDDIYVEINNQIFSLLIFIRDSQGNYVVEPVFFLIRSSFFMDPALFFALSLFSVLIAGGILIFLVRRSSARRATGYAYSSSYYDRYPPQFPSRQFIRPNFCPFCGSKVPLGALYCSSCGKKINSDQFKE
ncbi:MAG: S8 family serine peptidase [Candidatus Hermodarchaeota archaeon]